MIIVTVPTNIINKQIQHPKQIKKIITKSAEINPSYHHSNR